MGARAERGARGCEGAISGVPGFANAHSPHQLGGFQLSLAKLVPVNSPIGLPLHPGAFFLYTLEFLEF